MSSDEVDNPSTPGLEEPTINRTVSTTDGLENLQSEEQRRVLDTVAQVRKCGLDSILSLPQLVVCGDQSAGKSSVLEAITKIPFPRNDNLCTRYATEIILRRAESDKVSVKIIPDGSRPASEREALKAFKETISDYSQLPALMTKATDKMGIGGNTTSTSAPRAFAKDVLSLEISGPSKEQLTLVDIPGLIQSATKDTTTADVNLVTEITDRYISQSRTICLAVVSATHDYANQKILQKVREADPDGNRTLGIITKPDRLPAGSGSEAAYISLAKNEDIFFKLGWHVLKNRTFEEGKFSLEQRDESEEHFFRTSNFQSVAPDSLGINTLRVRLSGLLFEHVKTELPRLRSDLEETLKQSQDKLAKMGSRRTTAADCRDFLADISLNYHATCKAAIDGHYEDEYFNSGNETAAYFRRIRAAIQAKNIEFAENIRKNGHTYFIDIDGNGHGDPVTEDSESLEDSKMTERSQTPLVMTSDESIEWVKRVLKISRGRELIGSFNPLLVAELLWQQSAKWDGLAKAHVTDVMDYCRKALDRILKEYCPTDLVSRLWAVRMDECLNAKNQAALDELKTLLNEVKRYPINYNHYYTDTVHSRRQARQKKSLVSSVRAATRPENYGVSVDAEEAAEAIMAKNDADMENFSCLEALDSLVAIYKVTLKTFIANVTVQVIERHIVTGLETILSLKTAMKMSDAEVQTIVAEPAGAQRERAHLEDRIAKLKQGQEIFRRAMGGSAV